MFSYIFPFKLLNTFIKYFGLISRVTDGNLFCRLNKALLRLSILISTFALLGVYERL